MSTELERFRDHCRTMADPNAWARSHRPPSGRTTACFDRAHAECDWGWQSCRCACHDGDRPQPPNEAERVLWTQLADEIDAYLTLDDAPLWEDA